jgi:outer membrane lipoprotein SlyB
MKKLNQILSIFIIVALSGCARDLSMNNYTSDSVLSLTLEGKVISTREVTIKKSDSLGKNSTGAVAGGVAGAIAGASMGNSAGSSTALALGAGILGSVVGAGVEQQLSKSKGYEYIVQVDTSKLKSDYYEGSPAMRAAISSATTSGLITVLQGKEVQIAVNTKVYVIFSDSRVRIVPIKQ